MTIGRGGNLLYTATLLYHKAIIICKYATLSVNKYYGMGSNIASASLKPYICRYKQDEIIA